MEITITLKGIEDLPGNLESQINEKVQKLEKYFSNMQKAQVVINKQRGQFEVETTLFVSGRLLRAVGKSNLLDKAVFENLEKLNSQVKKYNEKLKNQKRITREEFLSTSEVEEGIEQEKQKVVKVKTFTVKPMSLEEATLQIELLDHDFFIFRDEETNDINVLYRRKDGNYGLIKPQK
jgi:putative sigma-54 modulation protein